MGICCGKNAQEPCLSTQIDLNINMDNNHMTSKVCDENTYPFPNFNGATVEVWEWDK